MYDIYSFITLYSVKLQVQGTEDFTKVMIVQTLVDVKKFRWNTRKYVPSRKASLPTTPTCELDFFE